MKSLDGGSDKFEFDDKCDKSITQQLNTNKTHCAMVTTAARVVDMSFYDFMIVQKHSRLLTFDILYSREF